MYLNGKKIHGSQQSVKIVKFLKIQAETRQIKVGHEPLKLKTKGNQSGTNLICFHHLNFQFRMVPFLGEKYIAQEDIVFVQVVFNIISYLDRNHNKLCVSRQSLVSGTFLTYCNYTRNSNSKGKKEGKQQHTGRLLLGLLELVLPIPACQSSSRLLASSACLQSFATLMYIMLQCCRYRAKEISNDRVNI